MTVIKISIITPCYNHGLVLEDAIRSVREYAWKVPVEHLIVNDGSTDKYTVDKFEELKRMGIRVIDQSNAGPANARNTAIRLSKGKYVLPLDADNLLRAKVFEKCFTIMENDSSIDVVYTNAMRFGVDTGIWEPGEIDGLKILAGNYIDTCSLIRKEPLVNAGCYDDQIPVHGNEDWELWLRYLFSGKKFYWLKEIGFEYRVDDRSLSRSESAPKQAMINSYIVKKFADQYAEFYQNLYREKRKLDNLKCYLSNSRFKSIAKIILNKPLIEY